MSLSWLRRTSRAIAAILLLTSMWQLPHRSQDDEICAPAGAESHDESKHVYTDASAPAHQEHCAVCHWTRWMKPAFAPSATVAADAGTDGDFSAYSADFVRDPVASQLPPRAPPSSSC